MVKYSVPKVMLLGLLCAVYLVAAVGIKWGVDTGVIDSLPMRIVEQSAPNASALSVDAYAKSAMSFVDQVLVRENGHVDLYASLSPSSRQSQDNFTNSEALSYYLLWNANAGNKDEFDLALAFVQEHMLHPDAGFMQWKLTDTDTIVADGGNVASDADLRAIRALVIAEKKWGDAQYREARDGLADALERVAVTSDGYLAPYGGGSRESPWVADEVWISYEFFDVMKLLASERGEPWSTMQAKMKTATLGAQIENGLFNTELTQKRVYGNALDQGGHSINSMWIMVRSAETEDAELRAAASRGLAFYKEAYARDGVVYSAYGSDGRPVSRDEAPWAYALVGRAAILLGDEEFSDEMVKKVVSFADESPRSKWYGAILEGDRAGQFTMQESILTLQAYSRVFPFKALRALMIEDGEAMNDEN